MIEANANELRQAILDKDTWEEVDHGQHCPMADFVHKGYVEVAEQELSLTPDSLTPEIRERLGFEGGERDHVRLSLFRKLIKNGDLVYLADSGEDAMIARFDRIARLSRDEADKMVIDGRWITAEYTLSPIEIQDGTVPHTPVKVETKETTESWRAIYSRNFLQDLYNGAPVDPETDEPDIEGLMKSFDGDSGLIKFCHSDPETATDAITENQINAGLAEFREMTPVTMIEISGVAAIVRAIRTRQVF
ncbi:MAG TPA: hypothetical protein VF733_01045 [Candidatus Saccharimonadales bacterium]